VSAAILNRFKESSKTFSTMPEQMYGYGLNRIDYTRDKLSPYGSDSVVSIRYDAAFRAKRRFSISSNKASTVLFMQSSHLNRWLCSSGFSGCSSIRKDTEREMSI